MTRPALVLAWLFVAHVAQSVGGAARSVPAPTPHDAAAGQAAAGQAGVGQPAAGQPAAGAARLFAFETDEVWLNLHHFLYVLGRVEAKARGTERAAVAGAPGDAAGGIERLTEPERTAWREAVASYADGLSRADAVFDERLSSITLALANADAARTLEGREGLADVRATLERAAPIYRKAWWAVHRAGNQAVRSSLEVVVARHGAAVRDFITRAYGQSWPAEGYPVHLSAYANWAGAYSTSGNLLVVATNGGASNTGLHGLEGLFHEGMHQWDPAMAAALDEQARKAGQRVPDGLSHALIFFTAGEAVRHAAPEHEPYADAFGVWQRGMMPLRSALQEIWKPYLDGRGTRDEALAALIVKLASA